MVAGSKNRSYAKLGSDDEAAVLSPSMSFVSKNSLVSTGEVALGNESDAEMDGTRGLQDEFDQYKDQNLEKMRSDVEDNVFGFEALMSEAVTRALMGDDFPEQEPADRLYWGCATTATGVEIEASVLWEVNEWLFQNEHAAVDQKKMFAQDILNRMVASVRYGVLPASDASRTIHESAALLGLPLSHALPTSTLIISGMMKTGRLETMRAALGIYGDIDTAALASRERGFGILRYRSSKSADRAMRRYRKGEVVIENVAVQIKVLTRSGQVDGRKPR